MLDTDAKLPPEDRFLFRVRQRDKIRGVVFVNVEKLLAFLRRAELDYHNKEGERLPAGKESDSMVFLG
jgi:hypothetical protein